MSSSPGKKVSVKGTRKSKANAQELHTAPTTRNMNKNKTSEIQTFQSEKASNQMEIQMEKTFSEGHSRGATSTVTSSSLRNLDIGKSIQKAEKFVFKRGKGHGVKIEDRDRHWILRLFYWFRSQALYLEMSDYQIRLMISDIACCGESTIRSIIQSDEIENPEKRGHPMPRKLQNEEEKVQANVLSALHECLEEGRPISSKDVRSWIYEDTHIQMSKVTLLKYCKNWGIEWRRLKQDEYRKERNYVLTQRYAFLKDVNEELKLPTNPCNHHFHCKCLRRRKFVFVDESYLHQNHVSNYGLTIKDAPLKKPSGKGKRIVIGAGFTEDGWLGLNYNGNNIFSPDQNHIYEVKSIKYWEAKVGGDFHKNFNAENFEIFFKNNILNNLTQPSLIILDRASYHCKFSDNEFFPSKAKKKELQDWLQKNHIEFDEGSLKKDLKILVLSYWQYPKTKIEILAENDGIARFNYAHKVLYLPPYHPEYNGIEYGWGRIKNYLGYRPTYNMDAILNKMLPEAFLYVNSQMSSNIVEHIIKRWKKDIDQEVDPLEITQKIQENVDLI